MSIWVFISRFYTCNINMSSTIKFIVLVNIIRCCSRIWSIFVTKFSTINSESRPAVLGTNTSVHRVDSIDVYVAFEVILLFICMSKIMYIIMFYVTIIIDSAALVPRMSCDLGCCLRYLHTLRVYRE